MSSIIANAWAWLKSFGRANEDDVNVSAAYTLIENWKRIYGNLPEWATYQTNGVGGLKTVNRKLTAAPKTICAELASLIWSEQPQIQVSDSLKEVLENNNFYEEMQKRIEYFAALGGMAVKGYYDGKDVKLDYVTADRFVPLSYDTNNVTDGQFLDYRTYKGKKYVRVETYVKKDTGYTITNELFFENKKVALGTIPYLAELLPEADIVTDKKLFSYIKYPVANNLDMESPLGISMFANSIYSLEALDTAYDLLNDELVLGRKRIIVPAAAMKAIFDETAGRFDMYFDTNDRVYQAMHFEENDSYKITDNSVELRVEQLLAAIDGHLRMIEFQTSFSPGSFSFDIKNGFKTATEVISDNSKTFKTKQAAENQIDSLIRDSIEIVGAISDIYKLGIDVSGVEISWDDSVIEDRNSKATYQIMLKTNGLTTQVKAIMEVQGVSEAEAIVIAKDIKTEQSVFVEDPGLE